MHNQNLYKLLFVNNIIHETRMKKEILNQRNIMIRELFDETSILSNNNIKKFILEKLNINFKNINDLTKDFFIHLSVLMELHNYIKFSNLEENHKKIFQIIININSDELINNILISCIKEQNENSKNILIKLNEGYKKYINDISKLEKWSIDLDEGRTLNIINLNKSIDIEVEKYNEKIISREKIELLNKIQSNIKEENSHDLDISFF